MGIPHGAVENGPIELWEHKLFLDMVRDGVHPGIPEDESFEKGPSYYAGCLWIRVQMHFRSLAQVVGIPRKWDFMGKCYGNEITTIRADACVTFFAMVFDCGCWC